MVKLSTEKSEDPKFLKEQINIVQPKIIAVLGATVFNILLRKYDIEHDFSRFRDIVSNYEPDQYILNPQDVYGPDFQCKTFRVLKEKEIRQYSEYRTRRLVLEAWDRLFGDKIIITFSRGKEIDHYVPLWR